MNQKIQETMKLHAEWMAAGTMGDHEAGHKKGIRLGVEARRTGREMEDNQKEEKVRTQERNEVTRCKGSE